MLKKILFGTKFLSVFIVFVVLCSLAFGDSEEKGSQILDSDESSDDKIFVCSSESEGRCCKCEKETLECIHTFIDGEILDHADLYIKVKNFILKNVDLRDNAITVLNKGFIMPENVKTIIKLKFCDNRISEIENAAFDEFEILEELDLSSNKLTTIDKKVFTKKLGSTLLQLKLNNNQIEDLTQNSFKFLTELKYLDLSRNKKLEVDSGIFGKSLSKLETLTLKWCDIETLDDDTFVNLKNLKKLDLQGNPLTTIPTAIINVPSVLDLDLSSSEISDINTDEFPAIHNLSTLRLTSLNKLFTVGDCAFCGLTNLENLILFTNKHLSKIDENAFGAVKGERSLQKLKGLWIRRCNFTTLPENLYNWEKFANLSIYNNPFVCDCSMAWLINNPKIYAKTSLPKCNSPPELNGKHFTSIAGTLCGGKGTSTTNKTKVLWALTFFIVLIIMLILYKNRTTILRKIYSFKIRQTGYGNFAPANV